MYGSDIILDYPQTTKNKELKISQTNPGLAISKQLY